MADLASTHFLMAGDFTNFADWRFIHRAYLNLVLLNGAGETVAAGAVDSIST
ncbi:Hypothetical protein CINCED_3A012409 [Cinara cedri]|uniref:Uncharacterized protein n=1 Tax=Cinara cedri TaxID=506608 RepID=A0A5E4NQ58_9HEMI|nr:Hypothetical protein CINCED_3A012409 [Cinara cedri]